MLALHPRLAICPILPLHLHQTKNKARWRSLVCPLIQVRYVSVFQEKTEFSFLLRDDAIQALVGAKYLPKSRLAFSLVSVANVLTPGSLYPQSRAIPLKKNPVTPSTSVTCITKSMVLLFGSLGPTRRFLAHINGEVSALAMLEFSLQMVASTSFLMFVCPLGTQVTLTNFPKAFLRLS